MKRQSILVLFVLLLSATLDCDEIEKTLLEWNLVAGAGLGLGFQFYAAMVTDSTSSALRFFVCPSGNNSGNDQSGFEALEFSYLYGKPFFFKTRHKGFISYSTGLSYLYYPFLEDKSKHNTIGIPVDIHLVKGITDHLGYGINFTFNYNFSTEFANLFFSLYTGEFKNEDYLSSKMNKRNKVFNLYDDKPKEVLKEKQDGKSILLKYNLLDNYVKKIFFGDTRRRSYRGLSGLRIDNSALLVTYNYLDCNLNLINSNYDKLIFAGLKGRFYSSTDGKYFDLGILRYWFHTRQDNDDEESWGRNYSLTIGTGYEVILSKYLTICSQLNLDCRISGDEARNSSILSYKVTEYALYIELFIPGIEFRF
jgi:hypothetical protein